MPRNVRPETTIRVATSDDLESIVGLFNQAGPTQARPLLVLSHDPKNIGPGWREQILNRSAIVAMRRGKVVAAAAIDLDRCKLCDLIFSAEANHPDLFGPLIVEAERLAVRFGILQLNIAVPEPGRSRFTAVGYTRASAHQAASMPVSRSLARRLTKYGRHVLRMGDELGIPRDYGQRHRLTLQLEATRLASIGQDVYGREQRLAPQPATAWRCMCTAALASGVELQAVSAFRSVTYQQGIWQRKLAQGQAIEDILNVSAAPGYSEHHTGRAIDVTTPGFAVLEEDFADSAAFAWMNRYAPEFGFRLSFPRNNRHALAYEPWHWSYHQS